ncbi:MULTISPECIES: hypothetical protein [unclassified Streptomyces]|uniref:hypothetical protein n=1 Tax=unclassified Streptomyces TaxID=2593676 RepID=UPI000A64376A|nr:hypothetical protein [Streptomyces sp. RTd22]
MSEARTDMTQARSQEAAEADAASGQGKHRGQQAASEEPQAPAHGRHRRPSENAS